MSEANTIKDRLAQDQTAAMRARDKERTGCIRMLRARLQEREVELRAKHGPDHGLPDEEALVVIGTYAKQRRDSIEAFRQGGREEMAAREEAELAIVQAYLPVQLSEDEVRAIVSEAVAEAGATSPKDMGAVMKLLMPRVKGKADGKLVSQLVREALA